MAFVFTLDIKSWMAENFLQPNQDKTEVLVINSEGKREIVLSKELQNFSVCEKPGCYFDSEMNFIPQIKNITKTRFYHLKDIASALDQFRLKSCIDFKPRDAEVSYISIQKLDGCYSYIGRQIANGQNLSISSGCDTKATVEHEILHALGFYHEQSRYDRDDYVTIVRDNILQGKEHNFKKVGNNVRTTHGTPYDYRSVMHYSKDDFTNGNGSTIITIDPKFQNVIGQRLEMSHYDVLELNQFLGCY
uniref:Metalloendopeptidase n=1 Tax=Oryzias latipes TaxID=8090 RepID=A0A3P9LLY4_ORYLA